MQGTIFNIQKFCLHDGPGIRTNVFLKGCILDCVWCHNPESKAFEKQMILDPMKCIKCGKCVDICPNNCIQLNDGDIEYKSLECSDCFLCVENCPSGGISLIGELISADEVIDVVLEDKPFYDVSNGGITITGGEPLSQPDFTKELILKAKKQGIHVCVETCGFADKKIVLDVLQSADIVLFDIKDTNSQRHRANTGEPCEKIIDNLISLDKQGVKTIIRCIMIKKVNMDKSHYKGIAELLNSLGNCIGAELIASHSLAASKAKRLGIELEHKRIWKPSLEEMNAAKIEIKKYLHKRIEINISGEK